MSWEFSELFMYIFISSIPGDPFGSELRTRTSKRHIVAETLPSVFEVYRIFLLFLASRSKTCSMCLSLPPVAFNSWDFITLIYLLILHLMVCTWNKGHIVKHLMWTSARATKLSQVLVQSVRRGTTGHGPPRRCRPIVSWYAPTALSNKHTQKSILCIVL